MQGVTESTNNIYHILEKYSITEPWFECIFSKKHANIYLYKKSNIFMFTHLRLSLTSEDDTVPVVVVVKAVVVTPVFTTEGETGTVSAVETLSLSFSVLSSAHKRFEVLRNPAKTIKEKEKWLSNKSKECDTKKCFLNFF